MTPNPIFCLSDREVKEQTWKHGIPLVGADCCHPMKGIYEYMETYRKEEA